MLFRSQDISHLSAAYRNMCEAKCDTPECVNQILQSVMYQNVLQASFQFNQELNACEPKEKDS